MKHMISVVFILLALLVAGMTTQAQDDDMEHLPADLVGLMTGENNVVQVVRFDVSDGSMEFLTQSDSTIYDYDFLDGNVAYVTDEAVYFNGEQIHPIGALRYREASVQLSPYQNELLYSDDTGLYALDLDSGEAELLIESMTDENNLDLEHNRYYQGAFFTADPNVLIMDIGVWESQWRGIFDRQTGALVDLAFIDESPGDVILFNEAMMLNDGRVMFYQTPAYVVSDPSEVWVVDVVDGDPVYQTLVSADMLAMVRNDDPLPTGAMIRNVIEMEPGRLRLVLGEWIETDDGEPLIRQVVADANIEDGILEVVNEQTYDQENVLHYPMLSPDGQFLVGQTEIVEGSGFNIVAIDMRSGEQMIVAAVPYMVDDLRWVK